MNLNERAYRILSSVDCEREDFSFPTGSATVLDVGFNQEIGLNDAIKVAEASTSGMGSISVNDFFRVSMDVNPSLVVFGSQMAGWKIEIDEQYALGSGPARILARKPSYIYDELDYSEDSNKAVLLLESKTMPTEEMLKSILRETGAKDLIVGLFRSDSFSGLLNVLARVIEVGFFRLRNLDYDIKNVVEAFGRVPMPDFDSDFDVMFDANDLIIQEGYVELNVSSWEPGLEKKAISSYSGIKDKGFKQIFEEAGGFYNIPEELFAPARLKVNDFSSKRSYQSW